MRTKNKSNKIRLFRLKQGKQGKMRAFPAFSSEMLEPKNLGPFNSLRNSNMDRAFILNVNDVVVVLEEKYFQVGSVISLLRKLILPDGRLVWMPAEEMDSYPIEPEDHPCYFEEIKQ